MKFMQIGNFHLGRAETAKKPALDAAETFLLWDQLISRYDIIEMTQLFQNFAHDPDFRLLLKKGLEEVLEKQVDVLEKEMNTFQVPLPGRPPKSVRVAANTEVLEDRMMFRQVFTGIQNFLDNHVRAIRSTITNDPLRHTFVNFAKQELDIFDGMCKFGKLKGWLQAPPERITLQ